MSDNKENLLKLKLQLDIEDTHPLAKTYNQLKDRGVKSPDVTELIISALEQVSDAWWKERVEEMIPLDIKVQEALKNPKMREKLNEFFTSASV